MTQTEHLHLIRARCVELLEIAEKRTAGRWNTQTLSYRVQTNESGVAAYVAEMMTHTSNERDSDATFIASCAGAAEAGWRATIAAIEWLLPEVKHGPLTSAAVARQTLESIISAWPIELLNNK